jgi:hypothetical protein
MPDLDPLPPALRSQLEAARAFSAARKPGQKDLFEEKQRWEAVLDAAGFPRFIPGQTPGSFAMREIMLAPELTPQQRVVAEALAGVPGVFASAHAIYSAAWVRRRWLGIDPPGVLFRELEVEHAGQRHRWPLFHALRILARNHSPAASALVATLPVRDQLELICDLILAATDYQDGRARLRRGRPPAARAARHAARPRSASSWPHRSGRPGRAACRRTADP